MLDTITYTPSFVNEPEKVFKALWEGLIWERRGSTPRREYYCNDVPIPYTYGKGAGHAGHTRSQDPEGGIRMWPANLADVQGIRGRMNNKEVAPASRSGQKSSASI